MDLTILGMELGLCLSIRSDKGGSALRKIYRPSPFSSITLEYDLTKLYKLSKRDLIIQYHKN